MSNRGNALGLELYYQTSAWRAVCQRMCLSSAIMYPFPAVQCIRPCSALREKSSVFVPSRSLAFIFFPFDIYLIKVPVFLPF